MIQVNIFNLSGIKTHTGNFETVEKAEEWIKKNEISKTFGKSERTVRKKIEKDGKFIFLEEMYSDIDIIKESFKEVFSGNFTEEKDAEGNIKNIPVVKKEYYVTLRAEYTVQIIDNSREEYLKIKINEINKNIEHMIINGFYSSCTGNKIHYQTSLTDQFEISQIKNAGIDYKIKIYDSEGISDRLLHTKEQITVLYSDFFSFISKIKINGDSMKKYLRDNYKTMDLTQLKNFNTGIEI